MNRPDTALNKNDEQAVIRLSAPMQARLPLPPLLLAAFLLSGCPNPNIYGTPRTTPKGEVSHTVAPEAYAVGVPTTLSDEDDADSTWLIPTVPSYTLRWGLTDRMDLGFRLSNLAMLGVDAKFNFLRSDVIDLALDPGVQGYYLGEGEASGVFPHLPLLIGLNTSDSVTILVTAGWV